MRDPFPIPPIRALSKAVEPWADYLTLSTLPLHIHEILLSAALYQFVQTVVSPFVSSRLFPQQYKSLSRGRRLNWDVHVVSLVQSAMINALAFWVMFADDERQQMDWQERIWGYTGASAMIQALAAGYFLWDLVVTASHFNIFGLGMLAHAVSALLVYSFGFRPFVNYYSTNFILWELSSPFLNIHWFFDKLGMTGSRAQLYNGIMLIVTFFSCRLLWGTYNSFLVGRDMWTAFHTPPSSFADSPIIPDGELFPVRYKQTMQFASESSVLPLWLAAVYLGANVTLNSLNFYWFVKMIEAVRKRFDQSQEEISEKPVQDDGAATGIEPRPRPKGLPRRRTILDGEDADEAPPI